MYTVCPTLYSPMDCSLPGSSVCGDLPDPGIEPVSPASPALQDSLPTEPQCRR